MKLVLVESPAKAKTIGKYLSKEYQVLATYGHVRDLPSKSGSVEPENDFAFHWELEARGARQMKEIVRSLKGKTQLLLATDPDREGEAIAWHVEDVLRQGKALQNVEVQRVVFHAVTKSSILEALQHPRSINASLVEAYLARRALDYLVGFTLSPVLWRKLPGSRSAGRVQSVALRLVVDREVEIEKFNTQEFWSITGTFLTSHNDTFEAKLSAIGKEKLDKFAIKNQQEAENVLRRLRATSSYFKVVSLEKKRVKRHPYAPFLTSTLQQDASRKLGFSVRKTMQLAQNLYEGMDIGGDSVGLITYMRTDSVSVVPEAVQTARKMIADTFGASYVPESPRVFQNKVKNAQEAHEAIRPTDLTRTPEQLKTKLPADHFALYSLIWRRMVASQMAAALFDQTSVDLANEEFVFHATGSTQVFDGFLRLYEETRDEPQDVNAVLPPLSEGEKTTLRTLAPLQHFTQPPPLYTEASLVKKLEELGIGRPSTYASILQVLRDRGYVRTEKKVFFPEERGRLVTAFLTSFFKTYVEYTFTADLEQKLDDVSNARLAWREVLTQFWTGFKDTVDAAKTLSLTEVIEKLNQELQDHIFQKSEDVEEARQCPDCKKGRLSLKLGKFGAFVGCSAYPECRYTRRLEIAESSTEAESDKVEQRGPKILGKDDAGEEIVLRTGRFGPYVQRGNTVPTKTAARWTKTAEKTATKDQSAKNQLSMQEEQPRVRASIPRGLDPENITLKQALVLLSLPKKLGVCEKTGHPVTIGHGRFGLFIRRDNQYLSIRKPEEMFSLDLKEALRRLEVAPQKTSKERSFKKTTKRRVRS
ncbi:MAG: type I DNA topoisomerase [Holosporales bacterium]|jgi:DNA topoisomerase-1|nr:type I DNA topoisomerase [Holosporales bacterium]